MCVYNSPHLVSSLSLSQSHHHHPDPHLRHFPAFPQERPLSISVLASQLNSVTSLSLFLVFHFFYSFFFPYLATHKTIFHYVSLLSSLRPSTSHHFFLPFSQHSSPSQPRASLQWTYCDVALASLWFLYVLADNNFDQWFARNRKLIIFLSLYCFYHSFFYLHILSLSIIVSPYSKTHLFLSFSLSLQVLKKKQNIVRMKEVETKWMEAGRSMGYGCGEGGEWRGARYAGE